MPTTKKATAKRAAKNSNPTVPADGTLIVKAGKRARFPSLVIQLEKAYHQRGCPGCRSGIDRITFQDQVITNVK